MLKMALLGGASVSCLLFGQVVDPSGPMSWVSNITGTGLCVFMVIRFGGSIDKLSDAITELRVHCASKMTADQKESVAEAARIELAKLEAKK